ncbi:MAG TPA: c-type cytochrome [Candidatus Kapabacteria bacterium]|nr:c-type cytochrome [Candidatus Kapabacteria bacterium]
MQLNNTTTRTALVLASGALLAVSVALFATNTNASNVGKWMAPASANGMKNPVAKNAASLQDGKKIFTKECVSCHGSKGLGNGPKASDLSKPPVNLTTHEFQSQSDGAIFWKITNGNKPMPMFRTAYSDQERWSVVNYLRTLGK